MIDLRDLLTILSFVVSGVIGLLYLGLKTRVVEAVKHEFESSLENLRSDYRNSEETLKSDLRSKESQISLLKETILSRGSRRDALLDERRIKAVDNLWAAVIAYNSYRIGAMSLSVINFEKAAERAVYDKKIQQFFDNQAKMIKADDAPYPSSLAEKPYISPIAWAYFTALQTILAGAYMRIKLLSIGTSDLAKLIDSEAEKKLLLAALPHRADYINKYGLKGYFNLLTELDELLVKELVNIIEGRNTDKETAERAANVMKYADELSRHNSLASEQNPQVLKDIVE